MQKKDDLNLTDKNRPFLEASQQRAGRAKRREVTDFLSFDFACKLLKSLQATLRTNGMRVVTSPSVRPERSNPLEKWIVKSKGQIHPFISCNFGASHRRARATEQGVTHEGRCQSPASCSLNPNLTKRNQALLYALGGFAVLLYLISFVRMGQW